MAEVAHAVGSFDVDAAICAFLADSTQSALEFPKMTNGQRKEARKIVEQHQCLKCESIGLAADRRLHVFKVVEDMDQPKPMESMGDSAVDASSDSPSSDCGLDLEAAIDSFLADPQQRSLQLPQMTTEQRKQARKIAEKHPELKCESFGLAADRRLHLFKVDVSAASSARRFPVASDACTYSVKNTFITGWVDADDVEAEPVVFRSSPVRLPELSGELRDDAEAMGSATSVGEAVSSDCWPEVMRRGGCSPGASTCASGCATPRECGGETPHLPEGLRIQNTFICGISDEPVDSRAVQSMPHGMFRQCLLQDLASQEHAKFAEVPVLLGSAGIAPQPPSPPQAPPMIDTSCVGSTETQRTFSPGDDVVIEGLIKLPAFNGLSGKVQSMDEQTGRYNILMPSQEDATGQRLAMVKGENLRPAAPQQPPCFVPLLTPNAEHHMPLLTPVAEHNCCLQTPAAEYSGAFGWSTLASPTCAAR
mmetsp:Transcript_49713/g.125212  ORF Transcript_49713/g.125212 Transcript_49713/m.125212 type:complete len:478 (-) Transcript_49713:142-1575(-)